MAKISLDQLSQRLKGAVLDKYKAAVPKAIEAWSVPAQEEAKRLIVETIKRGQSPVMGGRGQTGGTARFVDYSPMYKELITHAGVAKKAEKALGVPGLALSNASTKGIFENTYKDIVTYGKKLRPINLTLTGKMLDSIKSRNIPNGFEIWFTDKKAVWHTIEGVGKSRVKRKMLPVDPGDEFTRLINKGIVDKFLSILLTKLKEK